MAEEENTDQYGEPKTEFPVKELDDVEVSKDDVKKGRVATGDRKKTSTQTPDPNVVSVGDTTGVNTTDSDPTA